MTGMLAVKLVRDLRASWSRLVLMVIAIAISLTVFGGVLCAWSAIGRETSGAYVGTEPASATIVLDRPVDAERMTTLVARTRTRPGVIAATGRTQFTGEVAVNDQSRTMPLQVFVAAPDDPMRMARFAVEHGGWPPGPGELYLRNDTLGLLDAAIGDTVTVTTPSGAPARLRVAGTVYDPSLAPSPQHQEGAAYVSTASLAAPGTPAVLDQVKIQVADPGGGAPSRDRDAIVAAAGEVAAWLQRDHRLAIREIQVPPPYAHPHQWQADVVLLALLAGGVVAVLLSGILVANMLGNLFTQQIPQIGILKAIGARSGHIGRLYLAMTLLVAAVATLLALPPSILIGRAGVRALLGMLGVIPASPSAPWWAYPTIVAVGVGLPPLLALAPLVTTSRTTVRAAIDHHGLGSRPASRTGLGTGPLARLGRIRRLDRGLLMALRNTTRRPARFWLSVGLLASAGTVFVAGMSLSAGTEAIDDQRQAQRTWDVDVALADPAPTGQVIDALGRVPEVARVEGFRRAQSGVAGPGRIPLTRTYPDQGHGAVTVTAIPTGATTVPAPTLLEGRWLRPDETGALVINQITRANTVPGLHAGETVQLFVGGRPTTWRVVGIVEERERDGVYATADGLAAATGQPPRVNQLRIVTTGHDEHARQVVAEAVRTALTGAGIPVTSAASVSRAELVSAGHLGPEITILLAIATAMGVIGVIGLASIMSANVLDRTREFGVMHAIGARPRTVRRIVTAEGLFLALASCLVAAVPTVALTAVLGAGLGNLFLKAPLPYRISALAVGLWIVLVVLGAVLATNAAATRASRITVREALAYL